MPIDEYGKHLDKLFIKSPDNELLLELEWHISDVQKTINEIRVNCVNNTIDYNIFAKFLFDKLKKVYYQEKTDIKSFVSIICTIWKNLPDEIQFHQPFWTMNYADDPLSWGDEQQTRKLYEQMLNSYNEC